MASDSAHVGKSLELKSPMGVKSAIYKWPLQKGKGSVRRAENKEDEAAEILETIRYVREDFPEIQDFLDRNKSLGKYDPSSYESMASLCSDYNQAVEKYLDKKKKGTANVNKDFNPRCSRSHLKHILQKCYNKSVSDPNLLNHYEAFTPEVYGETSFELICQILDKLHPISGDNKFVDLGSGVGQVVLQVAALTDCQMAFGIEKANTPAKYAEDLERHFKFWMAFYGKTYSPFRLVHGDFLEYEHRSDILQSTIVFVNNFAFGPEVDQHLKDVFADLNDGARIFSSKSFCALNFRITDRNLSDIGTIMNVSKMDPLKGSVSWTGKPVSYYLHVIDRARLERYFQKSKYHEDTSSKRRRPRIPGNGELDDSSMDVSKDNSRASSVENDLTTDSNTRGPWNEDEFEDVEEPVKPPKRRGRKAGSKNIQKQRPGGINVIKLTKSANSFDENSADTVPMTDSNSSSPPPSAPAVTPEVSSSRPLRSSSDMSNQDRMKMSHKRATTFGSRKKKSNAQIASGISGLDLLHETTMNSIEASNKDVSAPTGCVNERLNRDHPKELVHEELKHHLMQGDDGKPIPFQLQVHLEKIKRQYLSFIRQMQDEDQKFKERTLNEIEAEKKIKVELTKREKQLKSQIDHLIQDSLSLLKARLGELGISAKSPSEFIEKAKGIVSNHHDLQRNKATIETEVRQLELEQEKIIQTKEKEMIDHLLKQGMTVGDAKRRVKLTIENTINALQGSDKNVSPLLNKLADVTLTKCEQLPSSTQIRKRPVVAKQKDWPEKKIKDENNMVGKIDEKNPEVLAKKIIAQGRNLEKSKSSAMLLSPRSKDPMVARSSVEVEVRRIEQPARLVDLPRVDLTKNLAQQNHHSSPNINLPPDNNQNNEPALVLPAHPRPGSTTSSEAGRPNHMLIRSTPKAEQFEDRLKTIIQSVLSEDPTRSLNIQANASKGAGGSGGNNKPMFSPVKKELPSHLPMPPSGVTEGPAFMRHGVKMRGGQPSSQGGSEHRLPTMNSAMRMDQIIEESLGNHSGPGRGRPPGPPQPSSNLEGLACPRTKSPNPPQPTSMMQQPPSSVVRPPHLGRGPPPGGPNSEDFHEYPAMEGLGARFSSIMEKRTHAAVASSTPSEVHTPPNHMLERSFSHPSQHNGPPNFNGPPAPGGPPPPSSNASLQHPGFPGGPHPGIIPHPGGHPPPGSGYPNSGPPTHGYPQIRKRASHSNSGLPVLPPKKQHMDMPDEFKYQKEFQRDPSKYLGFQQHLQRQSHPYVQPPSHPAPSSHHPNSTSSLPTGSSSSQVKSSSTTLPQMNIPQFNPDLVPSSRESYRSRYYENFGDQRTS